ncbi:MAG: HD domain-containing protein [Spirochaetales bacterium]|nr:HD domain-containing protein [Spirochaetales bacterium]
MMIRDKLRAQMDFLNEIEKLKVVYRQNGTIGGTRRENSAEHSWHVALMALTLQEYAPAGTDIAKVMKMLLIHDLVEIYTGDTFLYDEKGREKVKEPEKKAAEKLFAMLPEEQEEEFNRLWNEFEDRQTQEARFALVLDNLQPIMNHYTTENENIAGKKLNRSQIIEKKSFIKDYSTELWEYALEVIDNSVELGLYGEG